ncbi:MAG: hypothetical protein WBP88_05225 [Nitrososphaeraceae archaeon]|jgi:rubrerythrin
MEGLQKLKCGTCGTMFMSENGNTLCPSCLEGSTKGQSHEHGHEAGHGGCGCGH